MASEEGGREESPTAGWRERVEDRWLRTKEHAETYPYVWASYIVVYGGLGSFFAYRWRKFRRTEDRVRVLQMRLRKLVEAEEQSAAAGSDGPSSSAPPPPPPPPPVDKPGQ